MVVLALAVAVVVTDDSGGGDSSGSGGEICMSSWPERCRFYCLLFVLVSSLFLFF